MQFGATWDTVTKTITAAVAIVVVAVSFTTKIPFAIGVVAFLFALAYAWSPAGYAVSDGALVIRRLLGNISIPLAAIRAARAATADDFRGCIRLFGSGGLFGYYGLFRSAALGKSKWYMTDRRHAVVLFSD